MDAQGALDSFLGRLTAVLVDEAQLLGRVRGDVEFIKEEMECMSSLILQLTEAQHRGHLVRSWMKQVVGLARDCEGNVELYVHYVGSRPSDDDGLLGYLRRIPRFLRTILVRHRLATRIQELRVRARDIGDRRQRYGVTVPASTRDDMSAAVDVEPSEGEEDRDPRRRVIDAAQAQPPPDAKEMVRRGIESLVKWLSKEPAKEDEDGAHQRVRVFSVLGTQLGFQVATVVYQHSSVDSIFGCKASVRTDGGTMLEILAQVLEQVGGVQIQPSQEEDEFTNQAPGMTSIREERLISEIQGHLKGKRFLIVLRLRDGWTFTSKGKRILDALLQAADGCLAGSAIIVIADNYDRALSSFSYKFIDARVRTVLEFYKAKAKDLLGASPDKIHDIFDLCDPNTFAMRTFLHLLYVNPNRTFEELQNYKIAISECRRLKRSISKQVLLWCYNELPSKYRSCLLYLSVFPEGHAIRTTSLARRWVAEGLITSASNTSSTASDAARSSTDEAEHCLDVLFVRGFVSPLEISPEGNIKSCTVHHEVWEFIARVATDVNFMDSSLPPHLARYLSIHNRLGLQISHSDSESKDIATYLPSLAASPQWQMLKVLDLEGCKGLAKKKNLKTICKILLLKYLSLRNTDAIELPKQVKDLQCLETLDIRQTKVRMLANKAIVLPQLKHFLAGHKFSTSADSRSSENSFSAVGMPLCIQKMRNMEVLSHVQVSNPNELAGIAQLLRLRKLGVALHGKNAKLSDLFLQIEKLNDCLRSLSIRVDPLAANAGIQHAGMVDPLCSAPQFIERLNISGITGGLRHLIQEHHKFTKITLCETHLKKDDLAILGKLGALHCLRLQQNSYTESEISFRGEEFQSLNYLLVEVKDITKIRFCSGATPNLDRIVWCFARMDALSGLNHLHKLKKLELNGDCDLDPITIKLQGHRNDPTIKHKPRRQHQEDTSAALTSSSSDP